ncbi:hypothetical protein [Streptomyces sp. NPDC058625]|uniref:hypothetical protein n=1 Tax=Streptomyces sp. NPDC058625 TaxID=3346564 RepID=UPI00365EC2CF
MEPYEFEELGGITAQACLRDGLLGLGESDAYLGGFRNVAERAAAAGVLVAVEGSGARPGAAEAGGAGSVPGGATFVPGAGHGGRRTDRAARL